MLGISRLMAKVDLYFNAKLLVEDAALLAARHTPDLPPHAVAPNQGKLLKLLIETSGAKRVLEIGTLGGYSTIWLGRSAESVVSLEVDPDRAALARANIERAGLTNGEVVVGPAVETLATLDEPFDFVFIDADKPSNPIYIKEAVRLTCPGALVVADNVVRDGAIVDEASDDEKVKGVQAMTDIIAKEHRLDATAIQTVGEKGWDGFMLMRRLP